jgi:hypothetical protein
MIVRPSQRLSIASIFAAIAITTAGGLAVASNMAFRLRMPIVFAGNGNIGSNTFAVPFLNPYGTAAGACSAWGLTSTGALRGTIATLNPTTGAILQASCGGAGANALVLRPGECVLVRQPNVANAPTSLLIVGSHDPSLTITIPPAGGGNVGTLWYSVPYHATAYNMNDLCLQAGMTPFGAICQWVDASNGFWHQATCGTLSAKSSVAVIQLGQCLRCRDPNGVTFTPQTY